MDKVPLAEKLRPKTLDEFVGQEHLVGPNGPLRVAIEKQHVMSFILWGSPGVGKTTLARIYAQALGLKFVELSAVNAGKKDLREELTGEKQVLFLDEIHRFNKAQQDFLLPYVERGELILVGATTENPSFEVIPALLSRCRVFTLHDLTQEDLIKILKRTGLTIKPDAQEWLVNMANGDARQLVAMVDNTLQLFKKVTVDTLQNTLQSKHLRYDRAGEEHYNTISAFIKSMRAGDADAALYYLARMVESGEDPKFIARRMVIFASEDVGLAVPTALVVANEVFRSVEIIGYPECAINLAHGAVYLANCPKDRRAYDALRLAQNDVHEHGNLPIPMGLRNAPTKLMQELGYGKGESGLPEKLRGKRYIGVDPKTLK